MYYFWWNILHNYKNNYFHVQKKQHQTAETKGGKMNRSIGNFNNKLWEISAKFIADGSPHCGTAALHEPYLNTSMTKTLGFPPAPCYGKLNFTPQEFLSSAKKMTKAGKQIAVHCQGERACEMVLNVYKEVCLKLLYSLL